MAFEEKNKEQIKKENGVDILTTVAKDANNDPLLINHAKGLLWMLGEPLTFIPTKVCATTCLNNIILLSDKLHPTL